MSSTTPEVSAIDYANSPHSPKTSIAFEEDRTPRGDGPHDPIERSVSQEGDSKNDIRGSENLEEGSSSRGRQESLSVLSKERYDRPQKTAHEDLSPSTEDGPEDDTGRHFTPRSPYNPCTAQFAPSRAASESPTNSIEGHPARATTSHKNWQGQRTSPLQPSPLSGKRASDYFSRQHGLSPFREISTSPQEVRSSHDSSTTLNEPSKHSSTPPQEGRRQGVSPQSAQPAVHAPSALRAPGTRTPRKVQWGHSDDPEAAPYRRRSFHMLDEKGLDEERFKELTEALERHRAETPLRKVHVYSPQGSSPTSPEEVPEESPISGPDSRDEASLFSPSNSSTLALPQTTHDVPENLIGEHEDAGLPGTKDLRRFSLKKAEDVVQAHLHRKPGILAPSRSRPPNRVEERQHGFGGLGDAGYAGEVDVESQPRSSTLQGGKGILSTLLNLYQHPEENASSTSSAPSSISTLFERPWNRSVSSDFLRFTPRGLGHTPPEERTPPRRGSPRPRISRPKIPKKFGIISRPAAARSAGGVFGPLIATTGSLAGIAAPHSSRLQPNFKRPGYRLSRYEIETSPDVNPPRPKFKRAASDFGADRPVGTEGVSTTPHPSLADVGRSHSSDSVFRLRSQADRYHAHRRPGMRSGYSTPRPGSPVGEDEKQPPATSPFYKRNKRRKAEVFITRHVAQIIFREEFIMKLTRAMMMFGGPPHRLQSQIMSAARVLDIHLSALYMPDVVLLSFDDSGTGTSHIKLIRQGSALNIEKLTDAFLLYWKVIHDKLSVCDASVALDVLMKKKPCYSAWQQVIIGGMCSASICTVSFGGSFVDALVSFPLGALLIVMQIISFRNVLFTYVFEVIAALTFSFISAALAATHKLCYSAITSSSVVLILPGFLVLTGALELMSRNIVPGSVRLLYSVVYALFLGFGFSIGAELYELFTSHQVYGAEDYTCSLTHNPHGPWYQRTPSTWWAFLTVPMYSFFLSMRNQCPWWRKEMFLLVVISCVGWVTNYWTARRFGGQSDIIAGVGSFAVGLISNAYARIFSGNAFVVMITGILFQLPSGLGSGGLLSYASEEAQGSAESYVSGFRTALKLVSVAIGLTIGLGVSLALTHPIQSRKREAGIFSL